MENTLTDWTSVARELIQDASGSIPNVNLPIWTPGSDFASIRWPATLQQVLLKVVLVPYHYLYTTILWFIRAHIPHTEFAIHTICKEIRAIRTQLYACYHILMALKCHCNFTFLRVPYLYFIVYTAFEDLIRCILETNCCDNKWWPSDTYPTVWQFHHQIHWQQVVALSEKDGMNVQPFSWFVLISCFNIPYPQILRDGWVLFI